MTQIYTDTILNSGTYQTKGFGSVTPPIKCGRGLPALTLRGPACRAHNFLPS